jgi:hypothetical protein
VVADNEEAVIGQVLSTLDLDSEEYPEDQPDKKLEEGVDQDRGTPSVGRLANLNLPYFETALLVR